MCESVLKSIFKIYSKKINIMDKESLTFFLELMDVSKFRRCVFDEIIESDTKGDNKSIFIVYSGNIGVQVDGLND